MLRRRSWALVLVLLLVVGAGLAAARSLTPKFASTAAVLVSPLGLPTLQSASLLARSNAPLNLETESQIVISEPVAQAAAKLAHDPSPLTTVIGDITVVVPPSTEIMDITATTPSASRSQQLAQAFADAYLSVRKAGGQSEVTAATSALNAQLKGLDTELMSLAVQTSTPPATSTAHAYAVTQQQVVAGEIASVTADLTRLRSAAPTPGEVLTQASVAAPGTPLATIASGAAVLLGLLLGLLAMVLLERRDDRLHRGIDVERLLGVPLVAEEPALGRRRRRATPARQLGDGYALAQAVLATRLAEVNPTLLVCGVDGPSSPVTAHLATAFARTGTPTVLVCADLTSAQSCELLGIAPELPGLSDALTRPLEALPRHPTTIGCLEIVTPGGATERSAPLLQGPNFVRLVTAQRGSDTVVVIEGPASQRGADAQTMARAADGVVLVVRVGLTRRRDVLNLLAQLGRMSTPVLGAVAVPGEGGTAAAAPRPYARATATPAEVDQRLSP